MKLKYLKSFKEKTLGLAFKNKLEPVCFKTRWGIHTFFVKNPIDVFVCDNNFVIRKLVRNLKPFKIFLWNPKYSNVFEFPAGLKETSDFKIGSKVKKN